MGDSTKRGNEGESNQVKFRTKDIKRKPTYLTNVKKKKTPKDVFNFLFKGFHKYITIGAIALFLAGVTLLTLWLVVWYPESIKENLPPVISWEEQMEMIDNEAYDILESDSETAYLDAAAYYDEQVAVLIDPDQRFDLRIYRANFLIFNNGAEFAYQDLAAIDEELLSDEQKYRLYTTILLVFDETGDEDDIQVYEEKINALPKEITTIGGPAGEEE